MALETSGEGLPGFGARLRAWAVMGARTCLVSRGSVVKVRSAAQIFVRAPPVSFRSRGAV